MHRWESVRGGDECFCACLKRKEKRREREECGRPRERERDICDCMVGNKWVGGGSHVGLKI